MRCGFAGQGDGASSVQRVTAPDGIATHRVVVERREGRRVFYRLRSEQLAGWLLQGMDFLATMDQQSNDVRKAIKKAKSKWSK